MYLEIVFLQPTMWQVNKPFTCTFSHMTFLMSYVTFSNTHVDGLFSYHVVGWKRIPLDRVGGKLYLYIYIFIILYENA